MEYKFDNFKAGMRADLRDNSKRLDGAYPLGINVRSRSNTLFSVPNPADITDNRWVNVQGQAAMGAIHIVIADGYAWVRDYSDVDQDSYTRLYGYHLSADVEEVFTVTVPLSVLAYTRKLKVAGDKAGGINYVDQIPQLRNGFYSEQGGGLPCVIVQDGINKPMLIHQDIITDGQFVCRAAKDYKHWTPENPEYVPIGYQMLYVGKKLYIVGRSPRPHEDGRLIFHSVSGRPLDFMVVVDEDGNKLSEEDDGGARVVAHAVDFDRITALAAIPNNVNNFLVCTLKQSWLVVPNYEMTLFGEPTFRDDIYIGPVGAVTQYSISPVNGDIAIIGQRGIRSFNATAQSKIQSSSVPLAAQVHTLFGQREGNEETNIIQETGASIWYNDYTLFAVDTIYGHGVLVYDNVPTAEAPSGRYVSLDMFPEISNTGEFTTTTPTIRDRIHSFVHVQSPTVSRLFAVTHCSQVLEMFASDTYTPAIYAGDFAREKEEQQQKAKRVTMMFMFLDRETTVELTILNDTRKSYTGSRILPANATPTSVYQCLPFGPCTDTSDKVAVFNVEDSGRSQRVGCWIRWNSYAEVSTIDIYTDDEDNIPFDTKAQVYS